MKKKNQIIKQNSFTEFLLYTTPNGKVKVEILLRNENIWLTQAKIAELFGVQRPAITKHLKTFLKLRNWTKNQLVPFWNVLRKIAKNYLNEKELDGLNRIVTMYLDYAEMQAQKGVAMYMRDWVNKLDAFLQFNERDILRDNGEISHEVTVALAESEYEKYKKLQDKNYISDFDQEIKKLLKKAKK